VEHKAFLQADRVKRHYLLAKMLVQLGCIQFCVLGDVGRLDERLILSGNVSGTVHVYSTASAALRS
jgi:hypothetical protein